MTDTGSATQLRTVAGMGGVQHRAPVEGNEAGSGLDLLLQLQRGAGNRAVSGILSTGWSSRVAGRPTTARPLADAGHTGNSAGLVVQRAKEWPHDLPKAISDRIMQWEFRDIGIADIAALNDSQALTLKKQLDGWIPLLDDKSLLEKYKKAPKGSKAKKKLWDLYFATHKTRRSFDRLYELAAIRAATAAKRQGFSLPGSALSPPAEGEKSAFDAWSDEIRSNLTETGQAIFDNIRKEVRQRLEFLLWDIDYPVMPPHIKMRYGFFSASGVRACVEGKRGGKKSFEDFAPHLRDASVAVATSWQANIERGSPAGVAVFINTIANDAWMGLHALAKEAAGIIDHGIVNADVTDLYCVVEAMHATPGSVTSTLEKNELDAVNGVLKELGVTGICG